MAGIYLHIPFCRKACYYCDFHFSTNLRNTNDMVEAIIRETEQEKDFLKGEKIESIYFGGGTPSVLTAYQIDSLIKALEVNMNFSRSDLEEISLEANPDDLNEGFLKELKEAGIQRLSIGIQSLNDKILDSLNRSHNSSQAIDSLELARKTGFERISLDFIYNIPGRKKKDLIEELKLLEKFNPEHLSLYSLTIEEKTVFGNWLRKGKIQEMDEDLQVSEYLSLQQYLEKKGYEQYEISNFARNSMYAIHNSNYWLGKKYLGLGPSAHSYDGLNRRMNPSNNAIYIKELKSGSLKRNLDVLDDKDRFNEMLLTGLRTKWGVEKIKIQKSEFFTHIEPTVIKYMDEGVILELEDRYILSEEGKLIADKVAEDLFIA